MWECLPRKKRRDPQGGESQSEAPPAFQRAKHFLFTSMIATWYEIISKEPLGPVVRRDDEEWLTLVEWVLYALIEAEERGVTQANVRTFVRHRHRPGTVASWPPTQASSRECRSFSTNGSARISF